MPNAQVYKAVIVNYTRQPERQFEFDIGVDTDLDLNAAQRTAIATICRVSGVLTDLPATVLVSELGESTVSLTVRAWIDQRRSDLLKVRSEAIRQVKQAFDEAGIAMPEPKYRVRFRDGHMNIVPGDGAANSREVARTKDDSRRSEPESIPMITGPADEVAEGKRARPVKRIASTTRLVGFSTRRLACTRPGRSALNVVSIAASCRPLDRVVRQRVFDASLERRFGMHVVIPLRIGISVTEQRGRRLPQVANALDTGIVPVLADGGIELDQAQVIL